MTCFKINAEVDNVHNFQLCCIKDFLVALMYLIFIYLDDGIE